MKKFKLFKKITLLPEGLKPSNGKSFAFTLAEILITLGIIGVVAAMSIPTLMNKVENMGNKASAKKVYSNLSNITNMLVSENGGSLENVFTSATEARDAFAEKMQVLKKCTNSYTDGCIPTNYTSGLPDWALNYPGLILNDGTMIVFSYAEGSTACNSTHGNANNICAHIAVDTNGFKKPNFVGKDYLEFILYKDILRIAGTNEDYYALDSNAWAYNCATGNNPILCQLELFK